MEAKRTRIVGALLLLLFLWRVYKTRQASMGHAPIPTGTSVSPALQHVTQTTGLATTTFDVSSLYAVIVKAQTRVHELEQAVLELNTLRQDEISSAADTIQRERDNAQQIAHCAPKWAPQLLVFLQSKCKTDLDTPTCYECYHDFYTLFINWLCKPADGTNGVASEDIPSVRDVCQVMRRLGYQPGGVEKPIYREDRAGVPKRKAFSFIRVM